MTEGNVSNTGLSKSLYLRGKQCSKSLYLYKHHRSLRDEASPSQQAIFDKGTDVGTLAQQLFPGGTEISFDGSSLPEQVKETQELISEGETTIYEASFEYDGLFVMVDILHKGDDGWELYEVKSSTSVKDVNYYDVAFQYYVLSGAGIDPQKACLVHINNEYVRDGDIEVQKLFAVSDLTNETMAFQKNVSQDIASMRSVLAGDIPKEDIGPQCAAPYDCDFRGHCWNHIPDDSIFSLRGRGINKFDYYQQGIIKLEELPTNELNDNQKFQVEMYLSQGEHIDPEGLSAFLKTLWYPLCHFDFETFTSPVPLYDGMRPYQQVPFQYSMHIQKKKGGPIKHCEFLAEPNVDPREALVNQMLEEIPQGACVLAYNMAFEKTRIAELREAYPQYAERLTHIINNVRDLIVPFRKHYAYRWQQRGSNSIKKVLPAFTDLSYKDLEISDGGMAMNAYHSMCAEKAPEKLADLRYWLLQYCKRDTEAMVKLHECLLGL